MDLKPVQWNGEWCHNNNSYKTKGGGIEKRILIIYSQNKLSWNLFWVIKSLPSGALLTRNGVLIRLVRVSRMWTFSCWCKRIKRRKISSSAGSEILRRKRSRYAVVVITSSTVTWDQRQSENRWASFRCCDTCFPKGPWPHHSDPIKARTCQPQEHASELHLKPITYSHSTIPHAASAL